MYADVATGRKSVFIGEDGGELCNVEQVAMQHFISENGEGWRGVHAENSVFTTLFGLLMWDQIFANVQGSGIRFLRWLKATLFSDYPTSGLQMCFSHRTRRARWMCILTTSTLHAAMSLTHAWLRSVCGPCFPLLAFALG